MGETASATKAWPGGAIRATGPLAFRDPRLRGISYSPAGWSVPKAELVSKLQALLHAGQLRIAAGLPDAAVLARELQDFRVRFTEAGNATFNAREGAHDDLVLALALAVFGLSRPEWATAIEARWPR